MGRAVSTQDGQTERGGGAGAEWRRLSGLLTGEVLILTAGEGGGLDHLQLSSKAGVLPHTCNAQHWRG